jgi:hypothetical protein
MGNPEHFHVRDLAAILTKVSPTDGRSGSGILPTDPASSFRVMPRGELRDVSKSGRADRDDTCWALPLATLHAGTAEEGVTKKFPIPALPRVG